MAKAAKNVLITGAAKRLGRAIALDLAQHVIQPALRAAEYDPV